MQIDQQQARALCRLRNNPDFAVLSEILQGELDVTRTGLETQPADINIYRLQGRAGMIRDIDLLLSEADAIARKHA